MTPATTDFHELLERTIDRRQGRTSKAADSAILISETGLQALSNELRSRRGAALSVAVQVVLSFAHQIAIAGAPEVAARLCSVVENPELIAHLPADTYTTPDFATHMKNLATEGPGSAAQPALPRLIRKA